MNKQPKQVIPVAPRTYANLVKEYTESDYGKLEHKRNEERRKLQCEIKELNDRLLGQSHMLDRERRVRRTLEKQIKLINKEWVFVFAFSVFCSFGVGVLVCLGF